MISVKYPRDFWSKRIWAFPVTSNSKDKPSFRSIQAGFCQPESLAIHLTEEEQSLASHGSKRGHRLWLPGLTSSEEFYSQSNFSRTACYYQLVMPVTNTGQRSGSKNALCLSSLIYTFPKTNFHHQFWSGCTRCIIYQLTVARKAYWDYS